MSLMSMPSKRSSMASFLFPMAILPDGQIIDYTLTITVNNWWKSWHLKREIMWSKAMEQVIYKQLRVLIVIKHSKICLWSKVVGYKLGHV